jgi:hypothetical protein
MFNASKKYNPLNLNYKRIFNFIKKIDINQHSNAWQILKNKNNILFVDKLDNRLVFSSEKSINPNKIVIADSNNNKILLLFLSVKDSSIKFYSQEFSDPQMKRRWDIFDIIIKNNFIKLIHFTEKYLYYDDYSFSDARMEGLIVPIKKINNTWIV